MNFKIIESDSFTEKGIFSEDTFFKKIDEFEWSDYSDQKVLVRGCNSAIMPPWIFMVITAKLAPFAHSIRYGNEHDHITVFRKGKSD